jgi:hypothetical protein
LNIRLNDLGSVQSQDQHLGHFIFSHFKTTACCSNVRASGVKLLIQYFFNSSSLKSLFFFLFIIFSINWSALSLELHFLQSINGSENHHICQLASHTFGFIKICESNQIIFSLDLTKKSHQTSSIFLFNSVQYGHKSQALASHP